MKSIKSLRFSVFTAATILLACVCTVAANAGIESELNAVQSEIQNAQRAFNLVRNSKGRETREFDATTRKLRSKINSLKASLGDSKQPGSLSKELKNSVDRLNTHLRSLENARSKSDWKTVERELIQLRSSAKGFSPSTPALQRTSPPVARKPPTTEPDLTRASQSHRHIERPPRKISEAQRTLPLWRVSEEHMRLSSEKVRPLPEVASQGTDCNDNDPTIHPNQPESRCDGVDDNCNGEIDEGLRITVYLDRDHDLFGDPESGFLACPQDAVGEFTDNNFDCNDSDPTVNPTAGNCP